MNSPDDLMIEAIADAVFLRPSIGQAVLNAFSMSTRQRSTSA
jgi:hypothetical protein